MLFLSHDVCTGSRRAIPTTFLLIGKDILEKFLQANQIRFLLSMICNYQEGRRRKSRQDLAEETMKLPYQGDYDLANSLNCAFSLHHGIPYIMSLTTMCWRGWTPSWLQRIRYLLPKWELLRFCPFLFPFCPLWNSCRVTIIIMDRPIVIINGQNKLQVPGTTLADLRLSYPTAYLTYDENGSEIEVRSSSYTLGNLVYTLHIPPQHGKTCIECLVHSYLV